MLQSVLSRGCSWHFLYGNLLLQHDFVTVLPCVSVFFLNAVFLTAFFPSAHPCTAPALLQHLPQQKNSADGSSEPICAVPLYGLESYFFALTELGITQSATKSAKKDMAQRIAEQSKEAGPLAKPCLLLFFHRLLCITSAFDKQKKKSGSEEPPFHNSGYAIEKILLQAITEQPLLPRSA